MRHHKSFKRLIAIALMIALLPKTGVILYCHNWLHTSSKDQAAYPSSDSRIGSGCTCISDFSLPFTETAPFVLSSPRIVVQGLPVIDIHLIPSLDKLYHSLRAPPASVV